LKYYFLSLVITLSICFSPLFLYPAYSQTDEFESSLNGTDPTEPRTRFDAYLTRIEPLASGYVLQTTASGDYAFKDWFSIGMEVPLVYANFPSTVTFEIGDIQLNGLFALFTTKKQASFKRVAAGFVAYLNTGNVDTGTGFGQHIIAPYLGAAFYPAPEIMVTPIIEEYISLDRNEENRAKHDLSLRLNTTLTIDEVWVAIVPELFIDLLGYDKSLWNLRSSLGIMINANMGFSAEFISQLAGEKRFNYLGRIHFNYLLN
jgi:hypothetical protein